MDQRRVLWRMIQAICEDVFYNRYSFILDYVDSLPVYDNHCLRDSIFSRNISAIHFQLTVLPESCVISIFGYPVKIFRSVFVPETTLYARLHGIQEHDIANLPIEDVEKLIVRIPEWLRELETEQEARLAVIKGRISDVDSVLRKWSEAHSE